MGAMGWCVPAVLAGSLVLVVVFLGRLRFLASQVGSFECALFYYAGLPSFVKVGDVHQKVVMGIDDDVRHERSHSGYRDSRTPRRVEIAKEAL